MAALERGAKNKGRDAVNPLDLLLLACPAMLVACVFGMRGQGGQRSPRPNDDTRPTGFHSAALEERLVDLMGENDELRQRLAAWDKVGVSAEHGALISEERKRSHG